MTPASADSPLPEAIAKIERLEVRARGIVEGLLGGAHRSPYFGRSLDFREHRAYTRGDDLRQIDWKLWARRDRYYVKRYEEETNLRVTLAVDRSASMAYGSGAMSKFDYAATAGCALAYLALRQRDSVSAVAFAQELLAVTPYGAERSHLRAIAAALSDQPVAGETDLGASLDKLSQVARRKGIVVILSDLLGDRAAWRRGLARLRAAGHDVMVMHVLDDDELDFPFQDPTRFEGLEGGDAVRCHPARLRSGYLAALEKFLSEMRQACLGLGVDYELVRTSDPIDSAITRLLVARSGRRRPWS
ncbi:VWA domain containing CoxE-like protein [Pirellulimonas nuda]|uniref:VWA domain containing CoxE-like protein n=1 Tax=Pirellulimonas nuda TaxID=2528009 RepID=A0A518DBA6_9BACT|nr:DUF58 domain-containing protein [Pirellulimonas nuda]QDU88732.1 VWA domain containing CoxE-like protein [Pirellulimonas nuda]